MCGRERDIRRHGKDGQPHNAAVHRDGCQRIGTNDTESHRLDHIRGVLSQSLRARRRDKGNENMLHDTGLFQREPNICSEDLNVPLGLAGIVEQHPTANDARLSFAGIAPVSKAN